MPVESARLFWRDLVKAAHAWTMAPALPLASVLVMLPLETDSVIAPPLRAAYPGVPWSAFAVFIEVPFLLFGFGWLGTQRIWYLRIFRGANLAAREAWELSWKFLGRYFVLGVLVGFPIFALYLGVLLWQIRGAAATGSAPHVVFPIWLLIAFLAYWFVVDLVLTFVAPALAYTTARVRESWAIGQRMLRRTWPHCAVYALLPPLTLLALGRLTLQVCLRKSP